MKDASQMPDPLANEPATNQMTWALKLATGIDYRNKGLTRTEASVILDEANKKNGYSKKGKPLGSKAIEAATKKVGLK